MANAPSPSPMGSGQLTAVNQAVTVQDINWITLQLIGTFVGTVVFEQSNDNTTWVSCPLQNASVNVPSSPLTSLTAVGMVHGPLPGKFFRARCSAFTSGSIGCIVLGDSEPLVQLPPGVSPVGASTPSDALANPTTVSQSQSFNMVYNGTTWDRVKSNAARTSGAIGIPSVANGTTAMVGLAAVTVTGAGVGLNYQSGQKDHGMQVVVTGAPATYTVSLDGSLDGVNWFSMGTVTQASATPYLAVVGNPIKFIRANLTVLTGGTAPTVTANIISSS